MIALELAVRVRALGRASGGGLAVFDADGTLWREDVGEAFLRHLVSLGWVRLPDGSDPYEAYERAVDRDRAAGYAYAAQLQAGLEVDRLRAEAVRFAASWVPPRRVADTGNLLDVCREAGLSTRVISASPLPVVLAAASLLGFAPELCSGIEVEIRDGRFTDRVIQPLTYGAGKVSALGERARIALACGDSYQGDLALLQAAEVAVAVAPRDGSPLAAEARRRGWFILTQES